MNTTVLHNNDIQFPERLQNIVGRLDPKFVDQGKADINRILQTGIQSYTDLFRLVLDNNVDEGVRSAALWALSRLEDQRGIAAMIVALEDTSTTVRATAAEALGICDGLLAITATQTLINKLEDPEETVRKAAIRALGMIGEKQTVQQLIEKLLDDSESPSVRGFAAEALADIQEQSAIPALIQALSDPSPEVRYWCAFALGEIADPSVISHLHIVALSDNSVTPDGSVVSQEALAAIERIEQRMTFDILGLVKGNLIQPVWPRLLSSTLRLTTISADMTQPPESHEFDLSSHEDRAAVLRGYHHDGWLYKAKILEVASTTLSAIVKDIAMASHTHDGDN